MKASCQNGIDAFSFHIGSEIFGYLSDWQLLNKDSAACSESVGKVAHWACCEIGQFGNPSEYSGND